jgi:multiple sugar transport system substrate-binding protein
MTQKLSRRLFLGALGATTASVLAACQPQVVEKIVEKTVLVEKKVEVAKEVTKIVEKEKEVTKVVEKVVEATKAPRKAETVVMMIGAAEFPEEERKLFETKYSPYKIEFIETDMTKMMAMFAAGQPLDIFRNFGINAGYLVGRRIPKDLTEYFAVSQSLKLDNIMPVNDYFVVAGRRYGICKDWSPDYSIWIRKDHFEEAGIAIPKDTEPVPMQTWRQWSSKLTKKEGNRITRWGTEWALLQNVLFYQPTTYATPATLFAPDNTKMALISNKDNYEAAKFMFDWKKEGGIPSPLNPTIGTGASVDFQSGVCASTAYGYWLSGRVSTATWDINKNAMMLPAPKWGPTYTNPCGAATGAYINAYTRVPDAAWKLFEFYFGEESATARAKIGWGVPALKSLLEVLPRTEPWRLQTYNMLQWELKNSKAFKIDFNPYIDLNTINPTWTKYEESALKGQITFDEMLKNIETDLNKLIDDGIKRSK